MELNRAPPEALCAAHLNMLCEYAVEAFEEGQLESASAERSRGLLLDYKYLPGAVPNLLLRHFGIAEAPSTHLLKSMTKESSQYSKSSSRNTKRGKAGVFTGDSAEKEKRSTAAIDDWAEKIMEPTYEKMGALSQPVIQSLSAGGDLDTIGVIPGSENYNVQSDVSSEVLPTFAYEPFRNTHNSSRYEVMHFQLCLLHLHLHRLVRICTS
jgi:hypothetical protein